MKILEIEIKRFRSINSLKLNISDRSNLITLCGQNNVGKTNILRALNLFFEHTPFVREKDMPEYKQMTGGGSTYPAITVKFKDNKKISTISKDYDPKKCLDDGNLLYKIAGTTDDRELSEKDCLNYLKKINFFYLPSVNISFPELINFLVDDQFLDIEFGESRMRGKKAEIKENLEKARTSLQEILDDLTSSINPQFQEFHYAWGIKFDVPTNINKFREIINNEINFLITDDTQTAIHSKGAGLQRLGHILMVIRIVEKLVEKRKKCIVLIDEPDIYLHYRLQKQLKQKILELSQKTQLFITTHSPVFINPYDLSNLFLLKLDVTNKFSTRKNKEGSILETSLIDLEANDSVYLVKETLGIENNDAFMVGSNNLIVEGVEDKKYLEELIQVFGLPMPNIIPANGVTNIIKLLEYYDAISPDNSSINFRVVFDNDEAGREQSEKLNKKNSKGEFKNITVSTDFIIDSFDSSFSTPKVNIEIEDFIYPEVIIKLANEVIGKNNSIQKIPQKSTLRKIENLSLRAKGILQIIDDEKNIKNPEKGLTLSITGSGFKGGMSNLFDLKGNHTFVKEVLELDKKYPAVRKFLCRITKND